VADAGKKALGMRYKLLPYLYTTMHSAHSSGASLMRPLWMNFPADAQSQENDRWVLAGGQARPGQAQRRLQSFCVTI
jgi:alpha-glucosidase (family GH31 glycosyl hydrolase)